MKRMIRLGAALLLAGSVLDAVAALALAQFGTPGGIGPWVRQADRHNPFSCRYVSMLPGGSLVRAPSPSCPPTPWVERRFSVTAGCHPAWNWGYGPWGRPYCPPVVCCPAPCILPAWGLAPVYQPVIVSPFPFVGFAQPVLAGAGGPAFQDAALGNPPLANNPPPAGLPLDEPAAGDFPAPRESNAAAKARAWQFVDQGDKKFAEQNFHSAYVAYRKAAAQAADLPEVYLRQGQAFVAMSQWEKAADRFRRGMALVEEAPRRLLPLDQLYGGHRVEQTAHLENAVLAGQGQPHHPDFLFLIGTQFYFDGQPERSLNFFQRASELSGGDDRHIRPFLDRIALLAARPNAGAAP